MVINTNDPVHEREFILRGEFGSRNYYRVALMANTPLIEDKLAFRLALVKQDEDGVISNPTIGTNRYDARYLNEARAKLLWTPNDKFKAVLSYAYTENYGGEDVVNAATWPALRQNIGNIRGEEGSTHKNLGLRMSYQLGNGMVVEAETNVYRYDYTRQEDFDNLPIDLGILGATGQSDVVEQDLRLRYETEGMRAVVGLFYTKIEGDRPSTLTVDSGFALAGTPNGVFVNRVNSFATDVTNYAIYGEVEMDLDKVLPGLSFVAAMRYDVEEFSYSESTVYNPGLLPNSAYSGGTDFEAFLPKIGLKYEFAGGDQSIGLTYQKGYRAGGATVNIVTGALNEYSPEFTENVELSYRGTFSGGRLRIAANAFYMRWTDQQVSVAGATGHPLDTNVVNAGKSEIYGGELSIEGEPTEKLHVYGSVALAKSEFLNFVNAGVDYSGNQFSMSPEVTASLGLKYSVSDNWSVGLDASYTDAVFADDANTPALKSDSRWLLNMQVNYDNGPWSAGLFVRNVLDKDYAVQRMGTVNAAAPGGAVVSGLRGGEPRTVGFFVQRKF